MPQRADRASAGNLWIIVRFVVEEGRADEFADNLAWLIETMSSAPTFVRATSHRSLDDPTVFALYEEWTGSKDEWLRAEGDMPYRKLSAEKNRGILKSKQVEFVELLGHWERSNPEDGE